MTVDDSARPPVLAHQRFVADRNAFAGLNLQQRFQRIHDTNLWGAPASVSGLGSEIDATAVLRAELPALLKRLNATSLLDAPCGDGGWIGSTDLGVAVTGVDIVPDLIERLRGRAARGEITGSYDLADITTDALPRCDAILCRDCLVHLSFANIERAVQNFRDSGGHRYPATLVATSDHDDRVVPAHSFKFAARLQECQAKDGPPVLIRIETRAGHGGGMPLSKRVDLTVDEYIFLVKSLGMTPPTLAHNQPSTETE